MIASNYIFPKPKNEDSFEDIVCAIFAREFNNPNLQRYGRKGQAQYGMDIVGTRYIVGKNHRENRLVAIQCKNHMVDVTNQALQNEIDQELVKFEDSDLPVEEFLFVTSADNSRPVIDHVTHLNQTRAKQGKCPVTVLFWDFIIRSLSDHPELMYKYFTQFLPTEKPSNFTIPDHNQKTRHTLRLTLSEILSQKNLKDVADNLVETAQLNLGGINPTSPYMLYVGLSRYPYIDFDGQVDLSVDLSPLFADVEDLPNKYSQMTYVLKNLCRILSYKHFASRAVLYIDLEINFSLLIGRVFRKHKMGVDLIFREAVWTSSQEDVPIVMPHILEDAPLIYDDEHSSEEAAFVFNATRRTNIKTDVSRNLAQWSIKPKYVLSYHLQDSRITSSAHAISVAKSIAHKIHNLETWGIQKIHLFLAVPKPLATLIGFFLDTLNCEIALYFMGPDRQNYLLTGILKNDTF